MFHNGLKISPLSEEMAEAGLNPDKVMGEIDRNIGLMEAGSSPVSASGLGVGEGDSRSITQVGNDLIAERLVATDESESWDEGDLDEDEGDLDEAAKAVKMRSKAQRKKARRGPKYKKKLRQAKIYKRKNKAKIKKTRKRAIRKAGGAQKLRKKQAAASKAHKRLQIRHHTGLDALANLAEELEASEAQDHSVAQSTGAISPYTEAVLDAGWLCHLLGDIFECYGDERAAEALFRVGDYAADISEGLEELTDEDELSEEQEGDVKRVVEAAARALSAWEELGCPTLPEAIDYAVECDDDSDGDKKKKKSDDDESDDDDDDDESDDD